MSYPIQIVSRLRVAKHGEVFTAPREVNAMLDLVKQETERIESRFLEPACGTGNFLAEILRRKLAVVAKRYRRSPCEWRFNAFTALSSLYGIDILADNVAACRERLLDIALGAFRAPPPEGGCPREPPENAPEAFTAAMRFVLSKNIIHGDALTLRHVDGPGGFIVFPEWSPLAGFNIQRRDFRFDSLTHGDLPLFSDNGEKVMFPTPVKDDYPPTHYLEVMNNG